MLLIYIYRIPIKISHVYLVKQFSIVSLFSFLLWSAIRDAVRNGRNDLYIDSAYPNSESFMMRNRVSEIATM